MCAGPGIDAPTDRAGGAADGTEGATAGSVMVSGLRRDPYPCPDTVKPDAQVPASRARATRSVPNAVRIARYSRPVAAITAE